MWGPLLGRFISADDLVQAPDDSQTLNRYSYTRNNPLKYVDPSRHCFGLAAVLCIARSRIASMTAFAIRAIVSGAACVALVALSACNSALPMPTAIPSPIPAPTLAPAVMPTTPAPTSRVESSPTAAVTTDFAPRQRSVWDTKITPGETLGNCASGSILPVYGLVQITPTEAGLEWKNQEPVPYAMARIAPNTYRFAGPSSINDGVVTMTVTFVDEQSLVMLREFTPNADPGCIHRHEYTGEFKWFK